MIRCRKCGWLGAREDLTQGLCPHCGEGAFAGLLERSLGKVIFALVFALAVAYLVLRTKLFE
ncbi:MAG: hypothetical protein DMG24_18460 [Acidobacteria bacterium]|nr:MAG: hypothetical protein DMG24_18460 [Acidobacteriota bacterium]